MATGIEKGRAYLLCQCGLRACRLFVRVLAERLSTCHFDMCRSKLAWLTFAAAKEAKPIRFAM
jgi:hypothetical protein